VEYISTRGNAPVLDFEQATLTGLARDGGLYLPDHWPTLSTDTIRGWQNHDYVTLAVAILEQFTGNTISEETLGVLASRAYQNFYHDAIAPIKQLDDQLFFMELFHGPTIAFKDYALQLLGQLFQHFLNKNQTQCTIVGATSGDTGSAAIQSIRGLQSVQLFMLHPAGRVSDVQRRQMTTIDDGNIHNLAVSGTFDDCQNLVKAMFNDAAFREKNALSAVNSINWARIAAQVVYYFRGALALGAPDRTVNFAVPTGNFGNVLAGYIAKRMGLPVHRLIIGSNKNDILTRFFETGAMEKKDVYATLSPSMDIQISSNFERYLFELLERDPAHLNTHMKAFSRHGKFTIGKALLTRAQKDFSAYRLDDQQITEEIQRVYRSGGEIIDPHSIIGIAAARLEKDTSSPTIVLGTAHPAKFPDAVREAIGVDVALPSHLGDLMKRPEKMSSVDNDLEEIKRMINTRSDQFIDESIRYRVLG